MYKSYSMELAGRMLTIDVDRVCAQSNGAVLMHYGDTTVLSTCTASEKPRDGIDFFPLSVEYEEKMYAVGKFPGGFKKREGRASDNAILTARVIDRPMRPLFPKDYRNDVLLNNTVLSVDQDASPELLAMLGSALATSISDVPFDGPCATTQVGMIAGEFILNPGNGEKAVSDLLLTVASTKEKVIMIEAGANELPEEKMIEAIYLAHETNQQIIGFFESIIAECGKEKHSYESSAIPEAVFEKMKSVVSPEEMEKAVFTDEKQERDANISALSERLVEAFQDDEEALAILPDAIYQYEKKTVRKMILKDHKRPDGRAINEIRPLESEVDVLPRVHGSAMFKRGQTQILNITTLAPLSEVQKVEGMNEFETEKRYLHQYNFPGYSVGEAKASRGPGRREIGHGALAEKALIPVLPPVEEFPYAIRSVSETMESNGSTSMASTCASCMSLMAAGVPIRKPVAGISCGLVTGDSDDEYLVLTDIQGLEDFFGDMDFKVTGTRDGITAIQMDIKIHGLTRPIVEEAIKRAREARLFIMDGVMKDAIAEPRKELSPYAPKIITLQIETDKIGDVIGKQGKTITAIIEETGAKIDIDDSGMVSISGIDLAALERAKEIILSIVNDIEPGQILEGTVVRMMNFGAFVQLSPNKDGMVHISKLSDKRVNEVEDVVHIGDKVRVKVIEVDKMGRINLSMRPQDLAE
ncbi:polyribonucleotide nucleotidyltransferase [Oribacterium parvum]|uniref:polyribonucleotide nucleotidyltransferase n=1 Tax=Oribacterium parvum TaxID=1501329 RepID=UPI0028F08604|nr:polyribonucleotide nucleotidyltransferase [Oribacterium parvum]